MIHLNFYRNVALSSSLPSTLDIDQCCEGYAVVEVRVNDKLIYSATLFADDNERVSVYDFRKLVEYYMVAYGYSHVSLMVTADMGLGIERLDSPLVVVFSRIRTSFEMDADFLDCHFLTNRNTGFFTFNDRFTLYFYRTEDNDSVDGYISFIGRNANGDTASFTETFSFSSTSKGWVYRYIDLPGLQLSIDRQATGFTLVGGSIHIGKRSFSFFISPEKPAYSFDYINGFNVWERMLVFGSTTLKTECSAKEAVCSGVTSFYDREVTRKYEVTTRSMTLSEARHFNDFLTSNRILYIIPPDQDYDVLISDITSEISDNATEKVRMKFSWRFADNTDWRTFSDSKEVFNKVFRDAFS